MSRSYRKLPFRAICGGGSAKDDKLYAHRGERRRQNRYVKLCWRDEDNFLMPHYRECSWNNVWTWGRDGKQHWHGPCVGRGWWSEAFGADGKIADPIAWYELMGK